MFKIISTGWNCPDEIYKTLASVDMQTVDDWQLHVVDDCSTDLRQIEMLKNWHPDDRYMFTRNLENYGVVRSQYEGIRAMRPEDEDIIVFLDLDGDRFAHVAVLDSLLTYYADPNVLMTYGSYRPDPDPGGPVPISPYPSAVVRDNSYRNDILTNGVRFNHLRTVKWKVLKEIPESYYKWEDGTWMFCGSDYAVMAGCLEIAGGKYKCINETLMIYNAQQPSPDNMRHPSETNRCCLHSLAMTPLEKKF